MWCYDEQGNELGVISCIPQKDEEHMWGDDLYVCTSEWTKGLKCRNGMIFKKVN